MSKHANVRHLAARAELLQRTRHYLDQRGFLEVQPNCLSRDCVVDAYLDPVTIETRQLRVSDRDLPPRFYLQTSPESSMKRMLAAGAPSIYSIGPVFRAGELGDLHNIEFTMLEWYELGGDYESAIKLTGELVCDVLSVDGYDRQSYQELFHSTFGIDPLECSDQNLYDLVQTADKSLAASIRHDRDAMLDWLMSEKLTHRLGQDRPLIVFDYPISQAALAKQSPSDSRCASRFELFVNGVEIANGYDELTDANVLVQRSERYNEKRIASGRQPLDVETTLVKAMRSGLPACSGVALGLDRLLMMTVNADRISQVIPLMIWEA